MPTSLKSRIYEYIKSQYPQIVHKGTILKMTMNEWGRESENAGRRCRELEESGKIEVHYQNGQAGYKYIEPEPIQYRTPKETLTDGLNDDIMNILMNTPVTWNEQQKIAELNKALKSDYNETKEAVLKKYK
jgi:hypothetical protein